MKRRNYRQFSSVNSEFAEGKLCQFYYSLRRVFWVLTLCVCAASCSSNLAPTSTLQQPPSHKIKHHTVSRGETLYSIAWRYGRDFKELAAINGIPSPYRIFPGQRLQLAGRAPAQVATKAVAVAERPQPPAKKAATRARKPPPATTKKSSNSARHKSDINWQWPVRGRVLATYRHGDPLRKGVDIAGKKGESVLAAADGTVIYAGSALRGYGKLLIIKHSEEFLSAYAHNDKLLVGEGARVKAGQRIADLGSSGTDRDMLHFEIRRNGQPVDPMAYLP
ncbi:LysM peptidoglycan-binding domain-containing protein [Microbulbifer harenosus]|uniref:LysM peptidoglycan-binding domain-containing protein n=1 Tax=Microbulbifer harenosus TaxID=2576840 RepID=A0ABY2UJP9_9GAMM|nr:LysM peptidoglycan-binding domain-containing protein [Microbulbifer harenosus]